MIKFISKIKELFSLSDRLVLVQSELIEMENKFAQSVIEYSKKYEQEIDKQTLMFEKKIQQMTFAYTANLDDTKSDYLKRYLEVRMNGVQGQVTGLVSEMNNLNYKISEAQLLIENRTEN